MTWGDTKLPRDINRRIPYIVMQNSRSVLGSTEQKSFVIKKDGSLWGWGDTSYGQMGIILETNDGFLNTPRKVMEQVKDVSGDGNHLRPEAGWYALGMGKCKHTAGRQGQKGLDNSPQSDGQR